jgi:hypothetical protein
MPVKGLASYDIIRKFESTYIRCSGFGCWGIGNTRREAFDSWQQAVKNAKNEKQNNKKEFEGQV